MATSPLFVADLDTLKGKLRLSGAPTNKDVALQIDEAVLVVRSGFLRELGADRIQVIQAIAFNEDPLTDDETLRAVANSTEVKWVRCELMRTLPTLFMDSSADQQQIFQDEAAFRETQASEVERMCQNLAVEIKENLELLRGDEELGDETFGLRAGSVEPTDTPPRPGQSAWPGCYYPDNY